MAQDRDGLARPDDPGTAPAPGPRAPYQPPAVAWEEPFEAMAATTCGHIWGQNPGCIERPAT